GKARELCEQHIATTLPALKSAAAALNEERDVWRAEWESIAIRLSALIAEKLIHRELTQYPELSTDMVLKTLELASGSSQVRILLNPRDIEQLGTSGLQTVNDILRSADSQLVADESISPGGCVIQTQHGKIDAQLETQLDRICAELVL
ncbi:MAG: FliH/SctL family protein, partial [Planctomycetaceae bacterium]